jgi:hypothetical protein
MILFLCKRKIVSGCGQLFNIISQFFGLIVFALLPQFFALFTDFGQIFRVELFEFSEVLAAEFYKTNCLIRISSTQIILALIGFQINGLAELNYGF